MNITEKDMDDFIYALDGHKCEDCGNYGEDVTYDACPFASEIHGDETPLWLCESCRYDRMMDI